MSAGLSLEWYGTLKRSASNAVKSIGRKTLHFIRAADDDNVVPGIEGNVELRCKNRRRRFPGWRIASRDYAVRYDPPGASLKTRFPLTNLPLDREEPCAGITRLIKHAQKRE